MLLRNCWEEGGREEMIKHTKSKKKTTQNLEDRNPIVTEVGKFDKENISY